MTTTMTKQGQQSDVNNDGNDGNGGDSDVNSNSDGDGDSDGNSYGDGNGDGDSDGDGDGHSDCNGDGNGNGNGIGDSNDAAAAANGNNVDDNGSSIRGWQFDNNNKTMTIGRQQCTPTMMATMMMAETAMVTATAAGMTPPLPQMATMSMTTMVVIQGRQLDDSDLTTTMGQ
jgi:hypothetical protein